MYLDFVSLSVSIQGCFFIFLGIKILDIIINKCIKKTKMKKRSVRIKPDLEARDLKGRYRRQCGSTLHVCNNEEINLSTSKVKRKLLLHNIGNLLERT